MNKELLNDCKKLDSLYAESKKAQAKVDELSSELLLKYKLSNAPTTLVLNHLKQKLAEEIMYDGK